MPKLLKTYINVILLSIAAIFIVPFSWLHQCEYKHSHSIEKPINAPDYSFNEEIPSCPICELNFPVYLSGEYEHVKSIKVNSIEFKPFYNDSAASFEFLLASLRAPPFC